MRVAKLACLLTLFAGLAAAACDTPAPDPVVSIPLPDHPFGVVPSTDGCWLFVSLPTGSISVLHRDNGRVEIARTQRIEGRPTGIVLTHDGKTLIVGETLAGALTAFEIAPDGTLRNRRLWASTWPRVPDGIALNADGNIWIANPLAPECVLLEEGGRVLDVIATDQLCYACMLGGDDGQTLFICTAPTSLPPEPGAPPQGKILTAHVEVPHAGLP